MPSTPSAQAATGVLVVDDDLVVRRVLTLLLERHGVRVIAVRDGNAALASLASFTPRLVCVDLGMPGLSGFEVVEAIRARLGEAMPPTVILTASINPEDEQRAAALGIARFLSKPVGSADVEQVLVPLLG